MNNQTRNTGTVPLRQNMAEFIVAEYEANRAHNEGWRIGKTIYKIAKRAVRVEVRLCKVRLKHGNIVGDHTMRVAFLIGPRGGETAVVKRHYSNGCRWGNQGWVESPWATPIENKG